MCSPGEMAAMREIRIDRRFLLRTALVVAATVWLSHTVHAWQMRQHARGQLRLAEEARVEDQPDELIAALSRYLSFAPKDQAMRGEYALALVERAKDERQRWRALQVLRQAMASPIAPPEVRLRAAELALDLAEPTEARKCLDPLFKHSRVRLDVLELAVRADVARQQFASAVTCLRLILEQAPHRVDTATQLAVMLRDQLHQPRQGEAVLDRLVHDNPRLATAWLARARHRLATGKLEESAKDLKQARELAPRDVDVLQQSAEVAQLREQGEEACEFWLRAVHEQPERAALRLGLARAQRDRGQLDLAVATLREGLQRLPDNVDLLFDLADVLIEKGDVAQAERLRAALPKPAATGRSAFLAARVAQRDRRWLESAQRYVEALTGPDVERDLAGRLMLELASCYAELGARDEQFLATLQAARLSNAPKARLRWSAMLVEAGRDEDALPHLRSLTSLSTPPKATWALYAKALLDHYRSKPIWQRRWREVEQALEQAGDDPAREVTTSLLRAELAWLRQEPAEAIHLVETALLEHPDEPMLYLALADLATRQGDVAGARKAIARGDEVLGQRLDWLLARAAQLAGKRDPASYRELLRLEAQAARLRAEERDRLEWQLTQLHARIDNHRDVERLATGLFARHPEDVSVALMLVDALLARKADAEADRLTQRLRQLEGPNGAGWRSAAVAVLLAKAQGGAREHLHEARKLIEEIRKVRAGWAHVDLLAGKVADLEQLPEEALTHYRHALALGDYPPYAVLRVIQLLGDKGRWGEATDILEHARRNGMLDREFLRPAAWIALRAGQADRARDLARLAVPPGSRSYRDLVWLGRLLDAAGRETEAEEAFHEALQLAPDVGETWLARLGQLLRVGQRQEADELLERMEQEVDPKNRPLAFGQAQEMVGQFSRAEQTYRELLKHRPRDGQVLLRLANLYLRRNQPLQAEQVYRQLLSGKVALIDEDIPDLRRRLALTLTAPEQRDDRVDEALAILALNTRDVGDSEADRRVAALVRGRRAADRRAMLDALALLPRGAAGTADEQLRLAQLYDAEGLWPQAREQLRSLLLRDGGNGALLVVLIDGLLRHGKKAEAVSQIERLKKVEPECPRLAEFARRVQAGG